MTHHHPDASLYSDEQISGYKADNERRLRDAASQGDAVIDALPAKVTLELTADCDLFCKMCEFVVPRERGRKQGYGLDMPIDHFEMLAPQIFPSARLINLTVVGEPLLVPYLDRVLEHCRDWQTRLEFITHAMHLDQAMIEKVGPHTACVIVSFDGGTRRTFNRIRVGSDFNIVTRNVALYDRWRKSLPEGSFVPELHFGAAIMRENIEELPTMIRVAKMLGADRFNASWMIAFNEKMAKGSVFNHKALANAVLRRAQEVADEIGLSVGLPVPFPGVDEAEIAAVVIQEPQLPDGPLPHLAEMLAGGPAPVFDDDGAILPPDAGGHDIEIANGDGTVAKEGEMAGFGMDALKDGEGGGSAETLNAASFAAPEPEEPAAAQTRDEKMAQAQERIEPSMKSYQPIMPDTEAKGFTCKFLWNELFVSLSGDVAPCCTQGRPVVGNIHEEPLDQIWNGKLMKAMRKGLYEGKPIPACRDCNYMTQLGFGSYKEDTFLIDLDRKLT